MTDQTLKRKAFSLAMKLQKSGMEQEVIFARLEKEGIPNELAKEVLRNINLQANKTFKKKEKETLNIWFVISGISVAISILSFFVFPGIVFIPTGLIVVGLALGIQGFLKRNG